ncbi:MAG: 3TM-type holin [Burkholderiaceae bacterium]
MSLDWKDIAATVAKSAPILGTILGGPAGAAIGAASSIIASALGVENTPDAVSQALQVNPDAAVKIAQIEKDRQVELQGLAVQQANAQLSAETATIQAVNQTMQAEAASEHWPSYSWRPAIGFSLAFNVSASTVLVLMTFVPMMFGSQNMDKALAALPTVLGALAACGGITLPVIGVASWFRGKAQADPANPMPVKG